MEFSVKSGNPEKQRTACLIIGVYESRRLSPAAEQFDAATDGFLSNLLRRGDLEGKIGQSLLLVHTPHALCDRVLVVGCGRERDLDDRRYRQVITHMANTLHETGATEAVCYLTELGVKGRDTAWKVRHAVEATEEALYRFDELKSRKDQPRRTLKRIVLSVPSRRELAPGEQALREALAVAAGVRLARDLGNLPPNICTPVHLAQRAQTLAESDARLSVQVLGQPELEAMGAGALLAVARGSAQPPRLIALEYRGAADGAKPVVLVGKGVTFDTGGISIKPAAEMDLMKYDMCGAAAVLGTLLACRDLQLPLHVVGVIAAVENMPGGNATRPGDVITSLSGQTVEILNTDAEGRLILCDALTWVERHYDPAVVVDIATLTGACVIALGHHPHGLFSNHAPLTHDLLDAGRQAADRAWELPLWDDYQDGLDSNFADMANVGPREGGAITAACFLARYTKKFHWAHLDIAGTAWKSGKAKGATGRPVPLLTQFLLDRAAAARA
ncbi:aminopeptidase A [Plasticicumulans lactativorans]|uniref:Probable cytosol aminopeptidase n=1 Tax=Plasticicumulans lactativorans TaxID=1133106 RepID=A0A4R2LG06_9GAMM|nr:leucyl aminopeptidase [Plasticicumulans lactativorans]TCO83764.1 aminopeptidase A [Plasticicumulans lactativorans]